MKEINPYWRQLSPEEIARGEHRNKVGGFWEEIGRLQCEFLKRQGLLPEHKFLDIGCGCLRGGIHFIRYLNKANYYGLDINSSLIEAGKMELTSAGLVDKRPNLIVNGFFEFSRFGVKFNFALALSVFTHLFVNHLSRCLIEVKKVLAPDGKFYATFFQAPYSGHLSPILHTPGEVTTKYDSDPFHYSYDEIKVLAENAGLVADLIGEWQHPRSQKMLCFSNRTSA
jgi:ubiquinone/menaquinone biosynthesis C-methylase UbiE